MKFGKYEFYDWEDFEYGSRRSSSNFDFSYMTIYKVIGDNIRYFPVFEGELGYLNNKYPNELTLMENTDLHQTKKIFDEWLFKMNKLNAFW